MWVRYFVPEDGDDANHPNVFCVDRMNTLDDVKRSFPLSGNFHFRFMKELDKMTVWMDIVDSSTPLPTYQGGIFIKANRIRSSSSTRSEPPQASKSNLSSTNSVSSSSVPPAKTSSPIAPVRQPSETLLNMDIHDEDFGGPATSPQPVAASSPVPPAENVFGDNHDLLELSSSSSSSTTNQKTSSNADLFGLDTLQPVSSPMAPMGGGYYPQGAPRPAGGMNPMMGGASGVNGSMPRPMGAPMGGAPRPMGMAQSTAQFNRPGQAGMNGGGYDPFSSLGGMQQRK